ncbi:hypothetical protein [Carboxydothermus ferrireducens]|uniref:HTH cro/C1-type domain-containing protein n=1 Tax=Carboxydothermus ferrireducens DSM 11255 TaxID=1119529 RepID=A0ABX2RBD5_9THEO|nr:hypothetical protein [Carboxydothermus ferrireducens]NYE57177.1 hypothetical protein [Carboxydothermus ferrireducens DSM 11255]
MPDLDSNFISDNLKKFLEKVLLYRFTRNIDKILAANNISHEKLSIYTGRKDNWFNRTFNKLEDMKITSFILLISAISTILNEMGISEKKINDQIKLDSIIDSEMLNIAKVLIELRQDELEQLLEYNNDLISFFESLKFYFKSINDNLTPNEIDAYNYILTLKRSDNQ